MLRGLGRRRNDRHAHIASGAAVGEIDWGWGSAQIDWGWGLGHSAPVESPLVHIIALNVFYIFAENYSPQLDTQFKIQPPTSKPVASHP